MKCKQCGYWKTGYGPDRRYCFECGRVYFKLAEDKTVRSAYAYGKIHKELREINGQMVKVTICPPAAARGAVEQSDMYQGRMSRSKMQRSGFFR